MTRTVEYFYDFSSPYAYLAHEEIQRVAERAAAQVIWRPFLLGGLFKALGSAMVPIMEASAAKRAFYTHDMGRWAELRGLPLAWPSRFPMNTIRALRVVLQLDGDEHVTAATAIFRAYWADDRDINDPATLVEVLDQAGLNGQLLLDGTADPDVKQRLFTATDEAFARGACGAPAFFVGDLHFWGQDRLDMVERALNGWTPAAG